MIDVELPDGYSPSEKEEYMNPLQLKYFTKKLLDLRNSLVVQSQNKTMSVLKNTEDTDFTDMASWEHGAVIELKTSGRYRKLIKEVDDALARIKDGSYGFCEETGDEIGLARLQVNMMTLYCIEEQERREREKRMYNITDDEED